LKTIRHAKPDGLECRPGGQPSGDRLCSAKACLRRDHFSNREGRRMKRLWAFSFLAALFLYALAYTQAQRGGGEWLMHSGNPQRTAWQKDETKITPANVKDFQLLWKLKLDNQTHALHSLTVPLIANSLSKDIALVAGTDDNVYVLDADLGRVIWKKHFDYSADTPQSQTPSWLCPGGTVATPVITRFAAFGRGGRGARSAYVLTGDGRLHQVSLNDGQDMMPPAKFVPPNSKPYSLTIVDNTVYTITGQYCGGKPNAAYAMDVTSPDKKVAMFQPFPTGFGGGLWGIAGPAVGSDGTVFAQTGDGAFDPSKGQYGTSVIALSPKDLQLKDYYTPTNAEWLTKRDLDLNSTPAVFQYKGRELLAGTTGKEGRLFLLDAKSLGGPDHRTPIYRTPLVGNYDVSFDAKGLWGSVASWEDSNGTRWVLAPMWGPIHPDFKFPVTNGDTPNGSIVAFKVEDNDGKTVLSPAWVSRDLIAPAPPVVANGVVFALSSGENVTQPLSADDRARLSTHATLYAFDAQTGKELYSSGDAITSFTHFGALAVASGRVFFTTWDNTVYAFGIYIEH
jgi:outer membrane protein assembly factor BamB